MNCFILISLLFQDFKPCEVYSIEYMIDNTSLGFLVSDREKNLVLYMYQPEARESFGGYNFVVILLYLIHSMFL